MPGYQFQCVEEYLIEGLDCLAGETFKYCYRRYDVRNFDKLHNDTLGIDIPMNENKGERDRGAPSVMEKS